MPLHGKIVVIKRSGGDGTEFPLAASCLFGRKTDCDIRIQLPQVSKEHCRIDLNENKEVIVTNLSSANPTCINGQALQQSERLKHGDVITIIDRSFRFEYPPAPTPKKRSSIGGKAETLKVLQDHQVGSTTTVEKRISEASSDPHLKVGNNHDNIQRSLEKTLELESKEDGCLPQSKAASPFNDLYQMIKKSLDVKTPRKSSASLLQTPSSKFCTPQPQSVRKNDGTPFIFTACKGTPKREAARISPRTTETKKAETPSSGTPQSVKKQRRSLQASATKTEAPDVEAEQSKLTSPQTRRQATPQKFTLTEVIEQLPTPMPKSPVRRRSKDNTPAKETVNKDEEKAMTSPKTEAKRKATPKSSEKGDQVKEMPKKRKSGELGKDLPMQQMKKKRVSFGGHLSPELFDKRLPPNSPLRKGATPRRSLCLLKPKESLLRRASVIGLMKFDQDRGKNTSPKTPTSAKKSPASKTASPKTPSPGKKSPASKTASPKTPSPGKKSPASKTASPKTPTSAKKSPASKTASPKTPSPGKKSPASKTASPKTPTSAKKSPASKTASPKTPSPGKKSPASKTASPKTPTSAKKSPASKTASPKTPSPGNKSKTPKANDQPKNQRKSTGSTVRRRSSPNIKENTPTATVTPVKTPLNSRIQTPTVQGRFSVSRISTPSPTAVDDVIDMASSATVTPKIPLRRKSMKSTTKKTPGLTKSAVKVIRRSGISRVSMKAMNSWADIVKFGQAKVQRAAPTAKCQTVTKKTVKKVPKPQTPARRLKDLALASTGHANSPATIVVGRAVKQRVVHATGAAPRVVINTALSKKDMKMDEDMTGISEMFKTPVHERERSVNSEKSVLKTPVVDLSRSLVEPSMLNTPEEPGQMTVSPLTVKVTRYNSEAVQRLLNGDKEAISGDIPPLEISSDSSEQQPNDMSSHAPTTPNQKIELSECFTGVKRIMKTPKQENKPLEDLRGKLLKTPRQKPEPKECLTGVKRIMKTPKLKAEPVEDIRGNLLKTPTQKTEQQECLTGVKRMMRTPRQKSEPVEDIRGNLLKTPKQKTEQQECLTGVKRMMRTPRQKSEPVEDIRGNLLKTPKQKPEQKECLSGVKQIFNIPQWEDEPLEEGRLDEAKELLEMPKFMQESDILSDEMAKKTESSPSMLLSGIKTMTKTPKEKSTPVEDMVGLKRLMKTPKEKSEPVEKNFGIKRLMKSPRLRGVAPVEDFEGLEELMKEPLSTPAGQEKAVETEEQMLLDCDSAIEKELDLAEDLQNNADMAKADPTEAIGDNESEEVHVETGLSDAMDTVSESGVDDGSLKDQAEVEADANEVMPSGSEENTTHSMEIITQEPTAESLALETATCKVTEIDETVIPDVQKKSVRGRRAKVAESKAADDKQQVAPSEDPVIPAPVRGRRGKKTEAPAPPAVRQTARGRNAKTTESKDDALTQEESAAVPAVKPKQKVKKATEEQAQTVQEVPAETVEVPEDKQTSQVNADHEANDDAEPQGKPVVKRGKKSKQASVPQADVAEDASEVVPAQGEENTMDATETEVPEVKTDTFKVTENEVVVIPDTQKKPLRGRRAKVVESKVTDVEQAVASEEPVVAAPVKGRRGKKTEAPAPPAVRQTTRGRNAKAQEGTSDEKPEKVPEKSVETQMVPDVSAEDAGDQHAVINASHVDVPAPPEEKSTSKPKRGRKTKPTPVEAPQPEAESTEVVNDQQVIEDVQPELPVPTVDKPKRGGRKTKPDAGKQNEVTEDTVVPEETKQVARPPARAKRGRNAKEEEKPDNNEPALPVETPTPHEPVKKMRRTRKAEQDPEEPSEEVPTAKTVTPEEMVASVPAQPEKIKEATQVPKPRRGARKAQEPDSVTPVESTEVQEVPVVSSTDKPKRGRRGKQAAEEASVTEMVPEEKPEHEPETEEKTNTESTHAVKTKPSRVRGVKTSAKNEVSESVPAKRVRRGAAVPVEESSVEVTDVVPEPAPLPVEPVKRGRRAATKAKTNTEEMVSSDQVNSTEDSSNAVEDKKSKRSVKWKADCEVFEVTPLKAVRGRKLKSGDQKDTESNNMSKSATKTEEEDLSDQKSQPVKRARRGAKVTDIKEESTNKLPEEDQVISKKDDTEAQPKTRRGRSAKK
ncbi:proliferation marker protein Ki-67 isoform X3 [Sphaeramia orbicularis]|uniref:proliferation marker protein Ki-67 isoform X3 n=1 Tax=Sphaeramia orbicularis TaxID=375764 RepID=UPI00117CC705|nr:proliferation marker protein Ki-67-like isoform X3 [Sphaeramia orbicularis]